MRRHRWNDGLDAVVPFDPRNLFDKIGRYREIPPPRGRRNGKRLIGIATVQPNAARCPPMRSRGISSPSRRLTSRTAKAIAGAETTSAPKACGRYPVAPSSPSSCAARAAPMSVSASASDFSWRDDASLRKAQRVASATNPRAVEVRSFEDDRRRLRRDFGAAGRP